MRTTLGNVRPSWRAIMLLWREEFSFRFQFICAVIAVILSLVLRISKIEFLIVIMTIGVMFATEALNTGLEELCDHVMPDAHPQIAKVKDLGSAASGLFAIAAIIIGIFIFVPRLI